MQLRTYQYQGISDLRERLRAKHTRIILCMPTGAGKTLSFGHIIKRTLARDLFAKALILTDRIELMTQTGGTLRMIDLNYGFIRSGKPIDFSRRCWVGMVETFYRRLLKQPDLLQKLGEIKVVIFDESHKAVFRKVAALLPKDIIIIGATATPISSSKKDPLKNLFTDIVLPVRIGDLIQQGYLVGSRVFGPIQEGMDKALKSKGGEFTEESQMIYFSDMSARYSGVVENYLEFAHGKKALVFCVNIRHVELTTALFREAGIDARAVHSLTPTWQRNEIMADYAARKFPVLLNCGILTTGFDDPAIECIIIYRATKSLPLYFQMCGRGSRPDGPGKKHFTIIDHGNNFIRHGFWQQDCDWKAIFQSPPKHKPRPAPVKKCPDCQAIIGASAQICPYCGTRQSVQKKPEKKAQFALIDPGRLAILEALPLNEMSIKDLSDYAFLKKYKPTWVLRQLRLRPGDYEIMAAQFAKIRGYKPGWVWAMQKFARA